jgi:excisionase family DNA binding protein
MMGEAIDPRGWYTAAQAADLLGVSESTVRNWLAAGKLAGQSSGRGRRWSISGASLLVLKRASVLALDPATPLAAPVPAILPVRRQPKGTHGPKAGEQGAEGK